MPGTYWLTILPDTSKLRPAIQAAMNGVEIKADFGVDQTKARKAAREAAKAAEDELGKSDAKVSPKADKAGASRAGKEAGTSVSDAFRSSVNGERLGSETGGKFAAGLKKSLAVVGPMLGGLTIFQGLRASLSEGMDFTSSLNTLAGVSRATAQQLSDVSAKARQLGQDATLPGVSATTAAQAMTELAKGGFDVTQSMEAARGTLQLAGAAGIDAAQAATIQADALHAFGLSAKDAGYAADVLANVANASTGEITDFASGFQQAGAVASQFGLTIDDTAAALGTLANQGIKGSDAGTLVKSALLALTDQGKPAQGAIKELGLTVYDAQGKFVGMRSLMDQLGQAAQRMTPEMYQAATNTLFGSDAARLAGVAAKDGAKGFDALKEAVNKQGGAADMAAARMKGLPGAWANFQNTMDGVKLSVYDAVQGPLTGLLNVVSKVPDFVSRNSDVFKALAAVVATVATPALVMWIATQAKALAVSTASGIGSLIGKWGTMASAISNATAAAGTFAVQAAKVAAGGVASALSGIAGAFGKVATAARAAGLAMLANPVGLVIAGLVALGVALWAFFTKTETGRKMWHTLWEGIKQVAGVVWDWIKGALTGLGNALKSVWNFIQPAVAAFARFGAAVMRLNFAVVSAAIRVLGDIISWLWQNVAVPAFQGIAAAVSTFWSAAQVVWDAFKQAVQWVGDKLSWLWQNVAVPAFDAIKGAISTMWSAIKPIWDTMVSVFDTVAEKVGKIKDAFVNAFNGVKDIVQSVWNSIGGVFDKITSGIAKVTDWVNAIGGGGGSGGGAGNGGATGRSFGSLSFGGGGEGGAVAALAGGGRITGPGSGTSDSILARLSDGEFVVNAAMTRRFLPLLNAINSGAIPAFASGGFVSQRDLIQFASGVEGKPYVWGGTGWGDCSGAVSAVANYATGRDPFSSRFATATMGQELAARGFQPGSGGPGSLTIGWYNGGPGGGHTAATLPDGTHFEMGGKRGNGQFGGGAAGAEDSQFTNRMHLPAEWFNGQDGGAPTFGGGGGGMSYRAATSSELSASSNRVSAANNSVKQAQQSVDDNTYRRDRAQQRLDKAKAEGKDTTDAQRSLDVANRELADANDRLAQARDKQTKAVSDDNELRTKGKLDKTPGGKGTGKGGVDGSSLGQTFVSGVLEAIGLDGSLFSNPLEWPSVKSLLAGVNFIGGALSGAGADGAEAGGGGFAAGAADAVGLGGLLSAIPGMSGSPELAPGEINPAVPGATLAAASTSGSAFAPADQSAGAAPGAVDNSININGNVGMDPAGVRNQLRAEQNARTRTTVVR